MKKTQLGLALCTTALYATSALAADGTINFSGNIVAETCNVDINGSNQASSEVSLPTINASALKTAAQTAGATPFSIRLSGAGCVQDKVVAKPYFEPELNKINSSGRLINTGNAKNIDIQILDQDQAVIDLSKDANEQKFATANTSGDTTTYRYYAQYYATDAAEAGKVNSSTSYSIIYK
ncbi:fimbrial protein [Acinetobacter larvae]|uniref:Fimbrial protein n=1 Tax=Acinetobacter larvae TaxID=1789224 RepID=A0A1B2LZZ3_9GAMM|nr:fimbrial protein [Acinetobacter larvae]AOA58510.1 hypothetical protein BFG52_09215 [Acinetobacter larvae]